MKLSTIPQQSAEVVRTLRSLQMTVQSVAGLMCAHIYMDADTPDSLLYVEEWQAPEDLSQDAVAAHFKKLFALMERSTRAPVLRVASLVDTRGIEQLSVLMGSPSAAGTGSSTAKRRIPTTRQHDGGPP